MKIAIEFFGHYRTFEQCADNIIKNLIKPLNENNEVDIFLHTWNETDSSSAVWHNKNGEKRGGILKEENITFLKNKLAPKKIIITPQVEITEKEYKNVEKRGHTNRGYYSALKNSTYSRMQVNNLKIEYEKENNIEYDLVIQTRLDVFYMKKVNILEVKCFSNINNKIFYSWLGDLSYPFVYPVDVSKGGTDILYFGNSKTIDKFSNLYNKIDDIDFSKEKSLGMEFLLFRNADNQNLIPVAFNFYTHKDFVLLRTDELRNNLKKVTNFKPLYMTVIGSLLKLIIFSICLLICILFNMKFKKRYYFIKKIQKAYNKYFIQIYRIPSDIL